MELEEFYKQVGGNFEDVKRRLLNEEFIRKFVYELSNVSIPSRRLSACLSDSQEMPPENTQWNNNNPVY